MNKMHMGLIFVSAGMIFLMLSLTGAMTVLRAVSLGASILLNIAGTVVLMQCIRVNRLQQQSD